jgi:5-formyltetrahydrofolate cyclo-ligase
MTLSERKSELRRRMREMLRGQSAAQRAEASALARSLLAGRAIWREARSVLVYAPMPEELDLWPLAGELLAAGKAVALPRFDSRTGRYAAARVRDLGADVAAGQFGIREPRPECELLDLSGVDLILTPGLAFDSQGGRLGRGKGFYDQLLPRAGGLICGVGFDEQVVAEVPVDSHDVRVRCVLTSTRWIETGA